MNARIDDAEPHPRRMALRYAAFALLVLCAAQLWFNLDALIAGCLGGHDYDLIQLEALKASRGGLLTGMYSRFGFRHPGPFYFYLYAALGPLFQMVGASPLASYSLVQLMFNCVLLTAIALLMARVGGDRRLLFPLFLAVLLAAFRGVRPALLLDPWNPSTTVIPAVLLLVAAALVSTGQLASLWLAVLGFLLAASNHLGAVPVLGVLLIVAVASGLAVRRPNTLRLTAPERRSLLFSAGLGFSWMMPALTDALTTPGFGNIGKIVRFFLFSPSEAGRSIPDALVFTATFFSRPLYRIGPSFPGRPLAVLCGVLLLAWSTSFRRNVWLKNLRGLASLAVLLSIPAALAVRGEAYHHLMMYLYGVSAIMYWLAFLAIGEFARPLVRRLAGQAAHAASAAMLCAIIIAVSRVQQLPERQCTAAAEKIAAKLPGQPASIYGIRVQDPRQWDEMAALVLHLYRERRPVCVDPRWTFMFGEELSCRNVSPALHQIEVELYRQRSDAGRVAVRITKR